MTIQSMIVATVCLVVLTGCAGTEDTSELESPPVSVEQLVVPPAPVSYTYEVDIDPTFRDVDVEKILEGIEMWNARVGRQGLKPVLATLAEPSAWHIRVSPMTRAESAAFDGPDSVGLPPVAGWTGGNGLFCDVKIMPNAAPLVAVHEIGGHCFDIEHSSLEGNFMLEVPTIIDQINITDEQVALILGRLDGKR